MKIILVKTNGHVSLVINDIHNPKIDHEKNIITHSNGKVRLDEVGKDFLIVEDHIPVEQGDNVKKIEDYDMSHNYDSSSLSDVKEVIEEGMEEIKEEIKDIKKDDD